MQRAYTNSNRLRDLINANRLRKIGLDPKFRTTDLRLPDIKRTLCVDRRHLGQAFNKQAEQCAFREAARSAHFC